MGKKNETIIPRTQAKVLCKCGQLICFKNNFPSTCRICGRRVYPTKICELKDKLKRKGVIINE